MNDIGVAEIATTRPVFFDSYADNRATGSFILIDPATNATVAAGMIRHGVSDDTTSAEGRQHAALLLLSDAAWINEVEQLLVGQGVAVVRTRVTSKRLWQALLRIGVIVLLEGLAPESAHELAEELPVEVLDVSTFAPEEFLQQLRDKGILPVQKGNRQ
jgi:histidinol dehydrogenase